MEFFDKLGKKASEAYKITADKTGKIAKETKLKIKISQIRTNVSDLYEEIGKKVYEQHVRENKEDINQELEGLCTKIDVLSDEIEDLLQQCLELRDRKQCKNCYVEMDKECKYCPNCGAKQEDSNEDSEEDFQNVSLFEGNEKDKEENKEKDNKEEGAEQEDSNLEKTVKVESNVDKDEEETEVKNENSENEDNDDTTMY